MEMRTSKPKAGNKYFIRRVNGGWNGAIQGKPTDVCNVLANCVGYANGRFAEIIGKNKVEYQLVCNAENFIEKAQKYGLQVVSYPTLGGIMVWQKGATLGSKDGAGHVAIVERIDGKNTIYTSESSYGGKAFYNATRKNTNGRWGMGNAYTFRGCIINPAIGDVHYTDPLKSIDELAHEVINGLWGNGQERKDRLTQAGYDYNEVQNRVNEILQPSTRYYIVQKGDTLSGIAKKLGIKDWHTLYNNNKDVIGNNPNLIKVGQKLKY